MKKYSSFMEVSVMKRLFVTLIGTIVVFLTNTASAIKWYGPVVWGSGTIYLPSGKKAGAGDVMGYAMIEFTGASATAYANINSLTYYQWIHEGVLAERAPTCLSHEHYSCSVYSKASDAKGVIDITDGIRSSSPYLNEWAVVIYVCYENGYEYYKRINGDHYDTNSTLGQELYSNLASTTSWIKGYAVQNPVAATPVISPDSGTTFTLSLTVSMTSTEPGVTIHYTADGADPTIDSPVYKKFRIDGKTTVKAIAFYEDGTPSNMAIAEYALGRCDDPVIRPTGGTAFEHSGQRVYVSWSETNGVLRCTTDGRDPTEESPEYAGPFIIDDTTTIKAKVFGDTYFDSQIVTATLTRVWATVATPVVTSQSQFTGSKAKVRLSCATEGSVIHYTTDGSVPNENSPVYSAPFYVTESSTIKAYAVCYDYLDSEVASFAIEKVWGIGDTLGKPDHKFATSGDSGFVRVNDTTATRGESMKSGAVENDQRSILSTIVVGSGTLTFKWKTACEEDELHEWDHAEFAIDGVVTNVLDGITEWIEVSQRIEGDGEHTITWTYVKDSSEFVGEDCMWVSDYVWETDLIETQTTDVPVPYSWLLEKSRDAADEYDIYEKVAKQMAENKRLTVEQCYVAGLDPESMTNDFKAIITPDGNGGMKVTWNPDLHEEREYKVWGKNSLEQGYEWEYPTNSLHHFFKVTVDMPY